MLKVKDVRQQFIDQYDPSAKMQEIIGQSFIADEPSIFGKPNFDYIDKEIKWYISQSLNIYSMEDPPKIWRQVADKDGFINSNYGYLILNGGNYHQYQHVVTELKQNRDSRRGIMIYNRPSMWDEYNENGMDDFICTNAVNYFIRNNKLYAVVQMRSNDVIFGYKNDFAWQKYVWHKLAIALGADFGHIIWNAASLHIYPRHYYLIEKAQNEQKNKS